MFVLPFIGLALPPIALLLLRVPPGRLEGATGLAVVVAFSWFMILARDALYVQQLVPHLLTRWSLQVLVFELALPLAIALVARFFPERLGPLPRRWYFLPAWLALWCLGLVALWLAWGPPPLGLPM